MEAPLFSCLADGFCATAAVLPVAVRRLGSTERPAPDPKPNTLYSRLSDGQLQFTVHNWKVLELLWALCVFFCLHSVLVKILCHALLSAMVTVDTLGDAVHNRHYICC